MYENWMFLKATILCSAHTNPTRISGWYSLWPQHFAKLTESGPNIDFLGGGPLDFFGLAACFWRRLSSGVNAAIPSGQKISWASMGCRVRTASNIRGTVSMGCRTPFNNRRPTTNGHRHRRYTPGSSATVALTRVCSFHGPQGVWKPFFFLPVFQNRFWQKKLFYLFVSTVLKKMFF